MADAEVNPKNYEPHTNASRYSRELDLLRKIDRFGVRAILGRDTLYYGELRRMILAENIYNAYFSRKNSEKTGGGWAAWSEKNPVMAKILFELESE